MNDYRRRFNWPLRHAQNEKTEDLGMRETGALGSGAVRVAGSGQFAFRAWLLFTR